jgi:ATP-dependent DNA helicase RecQ
MEQIEGYLKKNRNKSGIIYCQSRDAVERVAARLSKSGFSCLPYHAGLAHEKRFKNQERFIHDDEDIIVATVAFGMGIDKPDVRFVIHYDLPKNLESYYQETGRGGRDGLECECILFFNRGDWHKIRFLFD